MRIPRISPFQAFLLVSGALISVVVAVSGPAAGRFFERYVVAYEEDSSAKAVQAIAAQDLAPADFELPRPGVESRAFETLLRGLSVNGVFRIKVYDRTGQIVWSDEPRLIGETFPDDPYPSETLRTGKVRTVIHAPRDLAHAYESAKDYIAEVHVPITLPGTLRVVGVIETYKDAAPLLERFRRTQRLIWGVIGGIGLFLYVALAFVAWKASVNEERAMSRLEAQNRGLALLHQLAHSLLQQPVEGRILQSVTDEQTPPPAVLPPFNPSQLARNVVERIGVGLDLSRASLCRVKGGSDLTLLADWAPQGGGAWVPPSPGVVSQAVNTRRPVINGPTVAVALFAHKDPAYVCVANRSLNWIPENRPLSDSTYLSLATFKHPISAARPIPVTLEIMHQEVTIALANLELFAEIREAHERLAAIMAAIADRLTIVDRQLRIVWMNAAVAETLERGAGSLGLPCFQVLDAEPEACEGCPAVRTFLSGKVERGVRAQRLAGGGVRYVDLVTAPIRDASGQVHQVLEVARDVTELVTMEEYLKAKTEELQRANQTLRETQAQLVEKERLAAAGEVVVGLHHEILNPLTGVLGALQILKQDGIGQPEKAEALAEAEAEIRKIEQLIRRLPTLRRAAGAPYVGDTTMLDLGRSCAEEERA